MQMSFANDLDRCMGGRAGLREARSQQCLWAFSTDTARELLGQRPVLPCQWKSHHNNRDKVSLSRQTGGGGGGGDANNRFSPQSQ